jgi:hypothetical protein
MMPSTMYMVIEQKYMHLRKKPRSFSKKFIVVVGVGILIAIAADIGGFYAMAPNKSSSGSPSATSSALTINGIE